MSRSPDIDLDLLRAAPPPPPLSAEVLGLVGEAPPKVRPIWPTWLRVALSAAVGGGITALLLAFVQARPVPTWLGAAWALVVLAWVAITVLLTRMALAEAEPTAPTRAPVRVLLLLLIAAGGFVAFVVAESAFSRGAGVTAASEGAAAVRCLAFGTVVEVGPVLVIFLLLARGAVFHPVRAGALGGVAAAGWSVLVLSLHCPDVSLLHVIPFHLGVALVWGLLGAGIGLFFQAREKRRARFPETGTGG